MRCAIIFLVLLMSVPLWATTYYVDNCVVVGSDSNNGTSTSTPWLTIAHVNAQSFNPGDSVLFQTTCTWAEELAIHSSGTSGNLINFGSYGTGATNPEITAADIVGGEGWTETAGSAINTQTFSTGGLSGKFWSTNGTPTYVTSPVYPGSTYSSQFNNANLRATPGSSGVPVSNTVELDFLWQLSASTATSGKIARVGSMEGSAWYGVNGVALWISYNGTNYQLSVGRGNSTGTPYNVTLGTWYLIRWIVNANGGSSSDSSYLYVNGTQESSLTGMSLTSAINSDVRVGITQGDYNSTVFTDNIDNLQYFNDNSTSASNVWYTTVPWQPYIVIFNETNSGGAPQSSASVVSSPYQWFWGSNILYVYSVGNPSTTYTAPGVQAAHRLYSIVRNGQSYFSLSNFITEGSNQTSGSSVGAGVFVGQNGPGDSGHGESSGVTANNMLSRWNGFEGFWLDSIGGTISNSTFHDNLGMGVDFDTGPGMTGTNLTSYNNLYGSYPGSYLSSLPNLTLNNFVAYGNHVGLVFSRGTTYILNGCQIYSNIYDGIYFDGTTVTGAIITGCEIYGNGLSGIHIASPSATNLALDYNLIWGNKIAGIYDLSGTSSVVAYGNDLAGNGTGLWVSGADTNLTAENNISYNNTVEVQVDSSVTATLTMNYNDWYHTAGGSYMNWKGAAETFSGWQAASNLDANSISTNPNFTNPGSNVYTLQSTSPDIDAGTNLGSTYEMALWPMSSWPSVVTANQNLYGGGWEIGAYVYAPPKKKAQGAGWQ